MNDLVVHEQHAFPIVPVAEIQARTRAIKQLISGAMVEGVDFGLIPGTQKKSLWKSGAEKICAMFRIADRYHVEDLSSGNTIRYRVTCQGVSVSGEILGEGLGEASTAEEKYRWRKAVCDEEFEDTPETRRRETYKHGKNGGHYKVRQIMTNEADSANTILKMAQKRAKLGMVLGVTACSDDFTQDVVEEGDPTPGGGDDEPDVDRTPKSKSGGPNKPSGKPSSDMVGEKKWLANRLTETKRDLDAILKVGGIASLDELSPESFAIIKAHLNAQQHAAARGASEPTE
jgi:hypothetical protein